MSGSTVSASRWVFSKDLKWSIDWAVLMFRGKLSDSCQSEAVQTHFGLTASNVAMTGPDQHTKNYNNLNERWWTCGLPSGSHLEARSPLVCIVSADSPLKLWLDLQMWWVITSVEVQTLQPVGRTDVTFQTVGWWEITGAVVLLCSNHSLFPSLPLHPSIHPSSVLPLCPTLSLTSAVRYRVLGQDAGRVGRARPAELADGKRAGADSLQCLSTREGHDHYKVTVSMFRNVSWWHECRDTQYCTL